MGDLRSSTNSSQNQENSQIVKMVKEAEEEEDQWLQTLREASGTVVDSGLDSLSSDPIGSSLPSDNILANALSSNSTSTLPLSKNVSRRASSHISETHSSIPSSTSNSNTMTLTSGSASSKAGSSTNTTTQQRQTKRSSVAAHSSSTSSLLPDGKNTASSGKEVKSFFENLLAPSTSITQKK